MQPTPNSTLPFHDLLAWWYGKWRAQSSSGPPTWRELEATLPSHLLPHVIVAEAKTERSAVRFRYAGEAVKARVGLDLTGIRTDEIFTGEHLALVLSLGRAVRASRRPVLSVSEGGGNGGDAASVAVPRQWRLFLPLRLLRGDRTPLVVAATAFDDADRSAEERARLATMSPSSAVDEVNRENLPARPPERLRAEAAHSRHVARYVRPSILETLLENTAERCQTEATRLDQLLRNGN